MHHRKGGAGHPGGASGVCPYKGDQTVPAKSENDRKAASGRQRREGPWEHPGPLHRAAAPGRAARPVGS